MPIKHLKLQTIETTVGELLSSVYETAMAQYHDDDLAKRIASQMLIRQLRHAEKMRSEKAAKAHK